MAHKTIALTTELRELLVMHPAQLETFAGAHVHCAAEPVRGQAKARKALAFDPMARETLFRAQYIHMYCISYNTNPPMW